MSFKQYLEEKKKQLKEEPTITTTSVGDSSVEGGSANFADKIGTKKKCKCENGVCKCGDKECSCCKK
jgi:hypothetical protein